ncbi:glia maturation factor beta [Histomonas meleagridis]|uniref:glia maturation factor beta n=1 Tax=Histomonas meleagridis TaxID=135588 RepID=UPI0035595EF7|nr:glia maturation factor beta [Histomonas meleagridis]KAH0806888.1 glia maturation factor beta [Histomonas meleagridis]
MSVSVDITSECRNAFDKLRVSRVPNHSFIIRPDPETLKCELEYEFPEGKSLDDLADLLPKNEPRFIVMMVERIHADGIRKSYPLLLIAYCPTGLAPQVNIVFTNARSSISRDFQLDLIWDVKKSILLGDEELKERFETNKWN